jgi:hypothetical protein
MKLHLYRKDNTNFNILCIIVFSGQLCFATTSSLINQQFLCKKTIVFEAPKDTSSLFYYSFEQRRVISFNALVSDANLAIVEACDGSDLVLSAPDYGLNASYFWSGPSGFRAKTKEIKLTKLEINNDGIYSVRVVKNDVEVSSEIKLVVNVSPTYELAQSTFEKGELIHLQLAKESAGNTYEWENPDRKIVSKSKDLWLNAQKVGRYPYRLVVKKNGCKEVTNFFIEIIERSKSTVSLSLFEIIRRGE